MSRVVEARVLRGFRDFSPTEQAQRVAMLDVLARSFERCGFAPIATPALEYAEILLGKYGEEGEKLLYSFLDHGDRKVALRYDLTVPLARFVAQHREIARPFKRYQIASVWRAEKPAHGRFREFMQCDVDTIGVTSPLADADTVATGILALESLGLDRFEVRIGHRGVLNALLRAADIRDPAVQVTALRILDKIDKVGSEAVTGMLAAEQAIGPQRATDLVCRMQAAGDIVTVATSMPAEDTEGREGAEFLASVLRMLGSMGLAGRIKLDLSIARGLDYYTGTVFETVLLDLPGVGSIMSGGRYDGLLEMFGMGLVPAVGISIGVDRLFSAMDEMQCLPPADVAPEVVICPFGDAALGPALEILTMVRRAGIGVEVVPEPSMKVRKQMEYASRRGARFALILGDTEVAERIATLKRLADGQQENVAIDQLTDWLKRQERP